MSTLDRARPNGEAIGSTWGGGPPAVLAGESKYTVASASINASRPLDIENLTALIITQLWSEDPAAAGGGRQRHEVPGFAAGALVLTRLGKPLSFRKEWFGLCAQG